MVGVAPARQAFAQESTGGSINIGGGIAATVAGAVSGIATIAAAAAPPRRDLVEHTKPFGEDEGVAISDASGGNHNLSEKSGSHDE